MLPDLSPRRAQIARAVAITIGVLIPLGLLYAWVLAPISGCPDAHWVLQTSGDASGSAGLDIGGRNCDVGSSLVIDLVFILGYVAIFTWLIDRGGRRMRSLPGRRAAVRLRWLPAIVGVLDFLENALIAQWALPSGYTADYQAGWVAAVSMPRWALTFIMLGMAAGAIWALADET